MTTDRQEKIVHWMKKRKVATMKLLQHQFQVSHMTVFRILKNYGYYTSYNHNAAYYTLHDVPQFDPSGLWAYGDIRFSRYGTLTETIVALIQSATAGATVRELEKHLQIDAANLMSRLVHDGRLTQRNLQGRLVVYLAGDAKQADQQYQHRQQLLQKAAASYRDLPEECSPTVVIEILRRIVLSPKAGPDQLARQLGAQDLHITASQVSRVIEHYALEKKRHR